MYLLSQRAFTPPPQHSSAQRSPHVGPKGALDVPKSRFSTQAKPPSTTVNMCWPLRASPRGALYLDPDLAFPSL